jgi:hypothetical protein
VKLGTSGSILLRRSADSESCCSAARLSSFSQIHAGRRHPGMGPRGKKSQTGNSLFAEASRALWAGAEEAAGKSIPPRL